MVRRALIWIASILLAVAFVAFGLLTPPQSPISLCGIGCARESR